MTADELYTEYLEQIPSCPNEYCRKISTGKMSPMGGIFWHENADRSYGLRQWFSCPICGRRVADYIPSIIENGCSDSI